MFVEAVVGTTWCGSEVLIAALVTLGRWGMIELNDVDARRLAGGPDNILEVEFNCC